jgi:hypothetical protein
LLLHDDFHIGILNEGLTKLGFGRGSDQKDFVHGHFVAWHNVKINKQAIFKNSKERFKWLS